MTGFLDHVTSDDLVAMVALTGFFLCFIVPAIGHVWLKARQLETDADLKREMIEKGMSADDIVRVLEAKVQ